MVRDEEFDNIPDLGPASDDMDRQAIPTLKRKPEPPVPPKAPPPAEKGSNGLIYFLLLVLIAVMGGFGFWTYQQQLHLESKLAASDRNLAQAMNRLSDLENLISATDESANKSGAALQAQLKKVLQDYAKRTKHVDSEVAKLWTIAYQRNKPQIESLDKDFKELSETTKKLTDSSSKLETSAVALKKQLAAAEAKLAASDKRFVVIEGEQKNALSAASRLGEQMRTQDAANQEIDNIQERQLKGMEQQLSKLQSTPQVPSALNQQLQEYGKSIESINSFRKQVNQELFRLRERVNQLQLAAEKPVATQK